MAKAFDTWPRPVSLQLLIITDYKHNCLDHVDLSAWHIGIELRAVPAWMSIMAVWTLQH